MRNRGHLRPEGGEGRCGGPEVRRSPHLYPDERDVCSGKSIYSISAAGVGQQQIDVINGREIAGGEAYHPYYGYKQEDISFIEALRNGTAPACSIEDAAKSMRMVEFLLENRI